MNKFYSFGSVFVVALVCVGLAAAQGGETEEVDEIIRCSLRQVSDEQLLEEVARRGHLRRPKHIGKPLRPGVGVGFGVGAGVGIGVGAHASKDRFGSPSFEKQGFRGSVEGHRGSSHSSKTSGEIEAHNNDFDDVQAISKHTDQSISSNGLFNKGKVQTSTEVDGFRRTKAHNQGGRIRGENIRNDNENSSGRIEFGQEFEKKNGPSAGLRLGAISQGGFVGGEEEIQPEQ